MRKNLLVLAISLIALLALGLMYGWSIFVTPLETEFGWPRSSTSLTFTISVVCHSLAGLAGGLLLGRHASPNLRLAMLLAGATLVYLGFNLACTAARVEQFYLFYGVLCGAGIGLSYITITSTVAPLFPARLGIVSGALAMSYGLGALLLGTPCSQLVQAMGWRSTFHVLGVLFAIVLALEGIALRAAQAPAPSAHAPLPDRQEALDETQATSLAEPRFLLPYFLTLFLTCAGLSVTGQVVPCAMAFGLENTAAVMVSGGVSLANGLGRILFGALYDRMGIRKTANLICALFCCACFIALAGCVLGLTPLLAFGMILLGASFGGAPPTSNVCAATFFEPDAFSSVLSLLNLQVLVAAIVGPWVSGSLFSATGSYLPMFIEIALFAAPACLLARCLGAIADSD